MAYFRSGIGVWVNVFGKRVHLPMYLCVSIYVCVEGGTERVSLYTYLCSHVTYLCRRCHLHLFFPFWPSLNLWLRLKKIIQIQNNAVMLKGDSFITKKILLFKAFYKISELKLTRLFPFMGFLVREKRSGSIRNVSFEHLLAIFAIVKTATVLFHFF